MENNDQTSGNPAGCLVRLFWMVIGNGILFLCAIVIADRSASFFSFSVFDIAYWATVAALMTARYIDIRHLNGADGFGRPASMIHLRRYVVGLLIATLCVWLLAHGIAHVRVVTHP